MDPKQLKGSVLSHREKLIQIQSFIQGLIEPSEKMIPECMDKDMILQTESSKKGDTNKEVMEINF